MENKEYRVVKEIVFVECPYCKEIVHFRRGSGGERCICNAYHKETGYSEAPQTSEDEVSPNSAEPKPVSGGLPCGEHNTTKNKIKPCNNKECKEYLVGEKDGFNCKGHIRGAVIYCPIYRA